MRERVTLLRGEGGEGKEDGGEGAAGAGMDAGELLAPGGSQCPRALLRASLGGAEALPLEPLLAEVRRGALAEAP